jgi:hypothetical protein
MISSGLAVLLSVAAFQASDTTRSAREAFTACLRQFVESSIQSNKAQAAFDSEYPTQCAAQQTAYREAIIRRDTASRMSQAAARESADLAIEDARVNFSERFAMSAPR